MLHRSRLLLFCSFFLTACAPSAADHTLNTEEQTTTTTSTQATTVPDTWIVEKGSNQFQQVDFSEAISPQDSMGIPLDWVGFIPQLLSEDGYLYGILPDIGFGVLNISEGTHHVFPVEGEVTLWVRAAKGPYVLIEQYSPEKDTATFELWNVETNAVEDSLVSVSNTSLSHRVDAGFLTSHQIFLAVGEEFSPHLYTISEKKWETISEQPSVAMAAMDNVLYFLMLTGHSHEVNLQRYDGSTQTSTTLTTLPSEATYPIDLVVTPERIYPVYGTNSSQGTLYQLDESSKTLHWTFGYNSTGRIQSAGPYVTWTSHSSTGVHNEVHLIHLDNQKEYRYNDSLMFLSQKGIAWFEYTNHPDAIEKGTQFQQGNSIVRYAEF